MSKLSATASSFQPATSSAPSTSAQQAVQGSASASQTTSEGGSAARRGRGRGRGRSKVSPATKSEEDTTPSNGKEANKGNDRRRTVNNQNGHRSGAGPSSTGGGRGGTRKGRAAFAGKLTSSTKDSGKSQEDDAIDTHLATQMLNATRLSTETSDLRSRLVVELATGRYDCAICYSCVTTKSAVWACSQCHTVLHLACVKKWAEASVEKAEMQNAMQDDAAIRSKRGSWRCPGCQFAREQIPNVYKCWDAQVMAPTPAKGVPPHSCGQPCAKSKCSHGCAAGVCHPGPCPPCPITITRACFCQSQQISLRCSQTRSGGADDKTVGGVSCGQTCNKTLACGVHACQRICHADGCGSCDEMITARCYCGREEKQMRCCDSITKPSQTTTSTTWNGHWACTKACDKPFDCGKHTCKRSCHPLDSNVEQCPFSPALITSCPCGAERLNEDRTSCEEPIKTCSRVCDKDLRCGHRCGARCHVEAECPPCQEMVVTPCRCGETKKRLSCHERQREEAEGGQEVLCNTVCRSVRLCGKHDCRRKCCPLYFQAKNKSKRRPTYEELLQQDPAGYHTCDVICGRTLTCGLHQCHDSCHRGPCPPCLQASFDEMSCHCGRTVLEPPVACGTRVNCHFPCARPSPSCGHPQIEHDCHDDETQQCPPCIYLMDKACMCGKRTVPNVPCRRVRVSCGQTCNGKLACGYHRCTQPCHEPGECGPCRQICAKPRRCGHPCQVACHAPSACPETEPCNASVTMLCACGHVQQRVRCAASLHNPVEAQANRSLPCTDACLIAQRNAKLADALGLNPADHQSSSQAGQARDYPRSALSYYGSNASNRRWCEETESTLSDLICSHRHAILMHPHSALQRQFIHELAQVFGLQTEDVDEEPRRAVAVRRSQYARLPTESLAAGYRQHQEALARSRPTALNPLKREPSGLNATLLNTSTNGAAVRSAWTSGHSTPARTATPPS